MFGKMKNLIIRNKYIPEIEPYIDKQIIKVIVGQRRVGKSYFLAQLAQHIQTINSLKLYIKYGGMPYLKNVVMDEDVRLFDKKKSVKKIKKYTPLYNPIKNFCIVCSIL